MSSDNSESDDLSDKESRSFNAGKQAKTRIGNPNSTRERADIKRRVRSGDEPASLPGDRKHKRAHRSDLSESDDVGEDEHTLLRPSKRAKKQGSMSSVKEGVADKVRARPKDALFGGRNEGSWIKGKSTKAERTHNFSQATNCRGYNASVSGGTDEDEDRNLQPQRGSGDEIKSRPESSKSSSAIQAAHRISSSSPKRPKGVALGEECKEQPRHSTSPAGSNRFASPKNDNLSVSDISESEDELRHSNPSPAQGSCQAEGQQKTIVDRNDKHRRDDLSRMRGENSPRNTCAKAEGKREQGSSCDVREERLQERSYKANVKKTPPKETKRPSSSCSSDEEEEHSDAPTSCAKSPVSQQALPQEQAEPPPQTNASSEQDNRDGEDDDDDEEVSESNEENSSSASESQCSEDEDAEPQGKSNYMLSI